MALGAILKPAIPSSHPRYHAIRLTFSQKIADFVLLDHQLNIVCIIELDDRTHRRERDQKRDAMLREAGYKTLRFASKQKPSVDVLRQAILKNV